MSQSEGRGEKPKSSCVRCSGSGTITTWYDTSEKRKITSACPLCETKISVDELRKAGL